MAKILAILAKRCHFSSIGDTKMSKYPLIVESSSCKPTYKAPIYMFSTKMKTLLRCFLPQAAVPERCYLAEQSLPVLPQTGLSLGQLAGNQVSPQSLPVSSGE